VAGAGIIDMIVDHVFLEYYHPEVDFLAQL
jgi:hypothetical protein